MHNHQVGTERASNWMCLGLYKFNNICHNISTGVPTYADGKIQTLQSAYDTKCGLLLAVMIVIQFSSINVLFNRTKANYKTSTKCYY